MKYIIFLIFAKFANRFLNNETMCNELKQAHSSRETSHVSEQRQRKKCQVVYPGILRPGIPGLDPWLQSSYPSSSAYPVQVNPDNNN